MISLQLLQASSVTKTCISAFEACAYLTAILFTKLSPPCLAPVTAQSHTGPRTDSPQEPGQLTSHIPALCRMGWQSRRTGVSKIPPWCVTRRHSRGRTHSAFTSLKSLRVPYLSFESYYRYKPQQMTGCEASLPSGILESISGALHYCSAMPSDPAEPLSCPAAEVIMAAPGASSSSLIASNSLYLCFWSSR